MRYTILFSLLQSFVLSEGWIFTCDCLKYLWMSFSKLEFKSYVLFWIQWVMFALKGLIFAIKLIKIYYLFHKQLVTLNSLLNQYVFIFYYFLLKLLIRRTSFQQTA